MCNNFSIENAAASALNDLRRTSFSDDGFTSEQVNAIARAIANAIVEYDRQTHSDEN